MKRLAHFLLGSALALTTVLTPLNQADAAQYELNFAAPYFDRHPTVLNVWNPWMEELNKRSGGKLEIFYFTPNTICPEPEILDSVAMGSVDIGGNTFTRNAGRLVIAEMAMLPMLNKYPKTTAMAWYEVVEKFPQYFPDFQDDVKLLFCWASAQSQIHTTKKPIRTLEDFKGMKIIVWTAGLVENLAALGAVPMLQSSADTYLALERGMADGVMAPIAPLRSQKLTDILRYHTIADLSTSPFWGGINRETYEDLPDDLRALIDETTGLEFSGIIGQSLEDGAAEDLKWILEQGRGEVYVLPNEERERWKQAMSGVMEDALKKVTAAGISEADAMEVYNYFMERIAYHNEALGLE